MTDNEIIAKLIQRSNDTIESLEGRKKMIYRRPDSTKLGSVLDLYDKELLEEIEIQKYLIERIPHETKS